MGGDMAKMLHNSFDTNTQHIKRNSGLDISSTHNTQKPDNESLDKNADLHQGKSIIVEEPIIKEGLMSHRSKSQDKNIVTKSREESVRPVQSSALS